MSAPFLKVHALQSELTNRRQSTRSFSNKPILATSTPRKVFIAKAKKDKDSKFISGILVGGAVFGTLGFLFAPQISKAIISEDKRLKLPKFLEDEPKTPDQAKQELIQKIAKLNNSIDEVTTQLKQKEAEALKSTGIASQ